MTFENLLQRISPKLKGIVHNLNGHFAFFDDDDLFQESLLHLWELWMEDRLSGKTDSYILQGCYFHLKNHLRMHLDKVPLVHIDGFTSIDGDVVLEDILSKNDSESTFDFLDKELLTNRLDDRGLSTREKEVANFFLDGLTVREIGTRLGISHVMVIKIKKRIRIKCATFFKSGYQN